MQALASQSAGPAFTHPYDFVTGGPQSYLTLLLNLTARSTAMRPLLAILSLVALQQPAAANTIPYWKAHFDSKGLKLKSSKAATLNTRSDWNVIVKISERDLVRQLALISSRSAKEEAYIHLSDHIALETGSKESFRVFASNCLVRATVQSSITIDDLISAPNSLPAKITWYHVHPSRRVIDAQFQRSHCKPPHTWPILPSSADISWFLERARKYYAVRPGGSYTDRIVVHPLGVIELELTSKGKQSISRFRRANNYATQVNGNNSMPGYRILPQRVIQLFGARIDRFRTRSAALETEIHASVRSLSSDMLNMRFIPMRKI